MVGVPPPRTYARTCLLRSVIEQPSRLLRTEASHAPGCCRRPKSSDHVVGISDESSIAHSPQYAQSDIIAKGHSAHEGHSIDVKLLSDCQSRRPDRTTRVRPPDRVVVVSLIGMSKLRVHDCRLNGPA